jgi:predicted amidophosphoribosyltransferase
MKELIYEIENQKDFYSTPVLSDSPSVKNEPKSSSVPSGGIVKYCQNCGSQADIDAQFCTNCGAKFEDESKCPNCGASIVQGDKFCTNCGNKL